jgi:hypothetical protein
VVILLQFISVLALQLPVGFVNEDQDTWPSALRELGNLLRSRGGTYTVSSNTKSSFRGSFIVLSQR